MIELSILLEPEENLLTASYFHTTPGCLGYFFSRIFAAVYSKKFYVALTDRRVIVLHIPEFVPIDLTKHISLQYKDVNMHHGYLFINSDSMNKRQLSFDWDSGKGYQDIFLSVLQEQSKKQQSFL